MGFAVSEAFEGFLEFESAKRIIAGDILGVYLHDHAAVGLGAVPMTGTHAVHYTTACFAAGRYDMTTGAHTERIDTASIDLRHERVGGITDVLHVRGMVHQFIDETLRVFGANTHGEAFGFQGYSFGR